MDLFERFIKEREYLKGSAPKTLSFYRQSWAAYRKLTDGEINKPNLTQFVIGLREKGMSTAGANSYIRGVNCFLSWLAENGHTAERLQIKQLKCERVIKRTFSDDQLKRVLHYKPATFTQARLHALLCTLADCGLRVNEAFTLTRDRVDFDNMLLTVEGKGNKQRIVPFSVELRKVLFKFLGRHKYQVVFPNRSGGRLMYDNVRRDFTALMTELGISGFDGSFHAFRRCFAKNYIRSGGNLFYLQQALGHEDIKTTRGYVEVEVEALQETHLRTSILSRLKRH